MISNGSYAPLDGIFPFRGLNTLVPSNLLSPSFAARFENLQLTKGVVEPRSGYQKITGTFLGSPMHTALFRDVDGLEHTVLFTTSHQYKYENDGWTDVTALAPAVNVTSITRLLNVVTVTATAHGCLAGDYVLIEGADQTEYNGWHKVATKASDDIYTFVIETTPASPATGTITSSRTLWDGEATDVISHATSAGTEGLWIVAVNGKEAPISWDGSEARFVDLTTRTSWAFTDFVTAKSVVSFYGHLIFGNIKRGSTWEPSTVAWSKYHSSVDFDDDVNYAGEVLIGDALGGLLAMVPLGDRVVLYFDNSIGVLTWVGGDARFLTEQMVQDTRLVSARGVVNLGAFHLLMRRETVSAFDGTRQLVDVGDAIYREYRDILSTSHTHLAFASLDLGRNKVYFGVPTGASETVVYVLNVELGNLAQSTWEKHTYAMAPRTMGFFKRSGALQYDSAELIAQGYDDRNLRYSDATLRGDFPVRMIALEFGTLTESGICDTGDVKDGTRAIERYFETVDFMPDHSLNARWLEVELELNATTDLYISTDRGYNWTYVDRIYSTAWDWWVYRVPIDAWGPSLRLRLTGELRLRWLRVWYRTREDR